ncbi:MAG: hypothetical protein HYZ74_03085 [Elusimicrobia bacterium]|nr:hypothetical protein [Elusimicrobiota bacterium]
MKTVLALAASLIAASAATAFAELTLDATGWQRGRVETRARPVVWRDVAQAELDGKRAALRGKAVLKNRGPKPAEGILLRYAVSARLLPDRGSAAEATWAIPCLIDERRVPKVGPNQVLEVPLSLSPKLDHYLAKLRRQGFRPDSLKLQAMLELHGAEGVRVVESSLEVK